MLHANALGQIDPVSSYCYRISTLSNLLFRFENHNRYRVLAEFRDKLVLIFLIGDDTRTFSMSANNIPLRFQSNRYDIIYASISDDPRQAGERGGPKVRDEYPHYTKKRR